MVNNLPKTVLNTIKSTFSLSGRASRKEFIVFNLLYFIDFFIVSLTDNFFNRSYGISVVLSLTIFYGISFLILIPPLFSLIVRRIHDLNTSAWWLLITLIPLGGLLFFALPFKKGTPGPNKYGDPPEY